MFDPANGVSAGKYSPPPPLREGENIGRRHWGETRRWFEFEGKRKKVEIYREKLRKGNKCKRAKKAKGVHDG
jgi:hypothetical protein